MALPTGVPPKPGTVVKGQVMTAESMAELDPKYYPLEHFSPTADQVAGSFGLVLAGFAVTLGVAHIGGGEEGA